MVEEISELSSELTLENDLEERFVRPAKAKLFCTFRIRFT